MEFNKDQRWLSRVTVRLAGQHVRMLLALTMQSNECDFFAKEKGSTEGKKKEENEGRTERTKTNWEKVWLAKEKEKENRTNMQKGFITNHIWVLTAITTHGCLKNEHGHKAKHTQNSFFSAYTVRRWSEGSVSKKESLGTKRLTSFVLSGSLLSITWIVWSSAWSVP